MQDWRKWPGSTTDIHTRCERQLWWYYWINFYRSHEKQNWWAHGWRATNSGLHNRSWNKCEHSWITEYQLDRNFGAHLHYYTVSEPRKLQAVPVIFTHAVCISLLSACFYCLSPLSVLASISCKWFAFSWVLMQFLTSPDNLTPAPGPEVHFRGLGVLYNNAVSV